MKRVLSGGGWAFGSKIGTGLATVGFSALLAQLIPPGELGTLFLAFSIVAVLGLVSIVGMEQVSVRLISERITIGDHGGAREIVKQALLLTASVSIGLGLFVWLAGGDFLADHVFSAPALHLVVGWMGIWVVAHGINILLGEVFRGFHDIRTASFFSGGTIYGGLLSSVLIGIMLLIANHVNALSLSTVLAIIVLSRVISMLVAMVLLHFKTKRPEAKTGSPQRVFELSKIGMPILISNICQIMLAQVDLWIIGSFRSESEVAIYGTAARVVKLIGLTLIVVNEIITPLIAELYVLGKREKLERMLRATAAVAALPAIAALAFLVFASKPFMGLLFGDFYASGSDVLILLSIGQMAFVFFGSTSYALAMTGHQKILMIISIGSSLITILGGFAVVGRYGATGVAAMVALGIFAQKIGGMIAVKKLCGIWTCASPSMAIQLLRETWLKKFA